MALARGPGLALCSQPSHPHSNGRKASLCPRTGGLWVQAGWSLWWRRMPFLASLPRVLATVSILLDWEACASSHLFLSPQDPLSSFLPFQGALRASVPLPALLHGVWMDNGQLQWMGSAGLLMSTQSHGARENWSGRGTRPLTLLALTAPSHRGHSGWLLVKLQHRNSEQSDGEWEASDVARHSPSLKNGLSLTSLGRESFQLSFIQHPLGA